MCKHNLMGREEKDERFQDEGPAVDESQVLSALHTEVMSRQVASALHTAGRQS